MFLALVLVVIMAQFLVVQLVLLTYFVIFTIIVLIVVKDQDMFYLVLTVLDVRLSAIVNNAVKVILELALFVNQDIMLVVPTVSLVLVSVPRVYQLHYVLHVYQDILYLTQHRKDNV